MRRAFRDHGTCWNPQVWCPRSSPSPGSRSQATSLQVSFSSYVLTDTGTLHLLLPREDSPLSEGKAQVDGLGMSLWILPKQHLNSLLGVSYQKWTHLTPTRSFKDYSNERIKNRNKERERKEGKSKPSSETFKTTPQTGYELRHHRNYMGIIFNEFSTEIILYIINALIKLAGM